MSDLISRSALLQKFNDTGIQITFDLPVEEILGEDVDIDDFTMLVQDAIRAYKNMIIGTIKDMPTAYDVEKVVHKLREITKCNIDCYESRASEVADYDDSWNDDIISACEAIDIVRKGGVG